MFARATQRPEFREAGADLPYRRHPALYSVVARLTRRERRA